MERTEPKRKRISGRQKNVGRKSRAGPLGSDQSAGDESCGTSDAGDAPRWGGMVHSLGSVHIGEIIEKSTIAELDRHW